MITIDEVTIGDPPEAWAAAGFTVDDDGVARVGGIRLRLVGRESGKRILGWTLRGAVAGAVADDIDGLATGASAAEPCAPATHPNGVVSLDHIVLLTPDTDRTVAALTGVGLEPRRTRETDTYGAPMLQTFFRAGEAIVELVGPPHALGEGEAGFFGLAFTVDDLDRTAALLGSALGPVKDAVQDGRRIATLRHRDLGMSVATALMTPDPPR